METGIPWETKKKDFHADDQSNIKHYDFGHSSGINLNSETYTDMAFCYTSNTHIHS